MFPIKDFNDTASLEFVGYTLEEPKYDVQECLQRGMTYAAPFKVTIRLVAWDDSEGSQAIRDVKEQEVYFGEIPIMTENGTFIINGTERVIVSPAAPLAGHLLRHEHVARRVSAAGKKIYSCRMIPYRGSWLDLEFDHKDLLYARIDRRRKIHATVLLKALGYTPEDLLAYFYKPEIDPRRRQEVREERRAGPARRAALPREVKDDDGTVLVRKDRKFTSAGVRKMREAGIEWIQIPVEDLDPRRRRASASRPSTSSTRRTGEVILECNEELTEDKLDELHDARHRRVPAALPRPADHRHRAARHAARRQDADAGGGDHRDLPPPAAGRSADGRDGDEPVPQPVLQPGALRPLERRPAQGQPQALLHAEERVRWQPNGPDARGDPARELPTLRPTTSSRR